MNLLKCDKSERLRESLEREASNLIQLGLSTDNLQDLYLSTSQSDVQFRIIELMYRLAKAEFKIVVRHFRQKLKH